MIKLGKLAYGSRVDIQKDSVLSLMAVSLFQFFFFLETKMDNSMAFDVMTKFKTISLVFLS